MENNAEKEIVERLAVIETKLDTILPIFTNLDQRVRNIEINREECRQDGRIEKIEIRLGEGERRFDDLDKIITSHISSSEGKEKAHVTIREFAILVIAVVEMIIIVIPFVMGK
jgi:hypothetical protein